MRNLLKTEEAGLFLLSIFLFSQLGFSWWVYLLLIITPDAGMVGYLVSPGVGAVTYNATHHRGLASGLIMVGALSSSPVVSLAGIIMLGHSSLDRVFGYGLKYMDSFNHTHLGLIGRGGRPNIETG